MTSQVQNISNSNKSIESDSTFQALMNNGKSFLSPASAQPIIPSNEELNAASLLLNFDEDGSFKDLANQDLAFLRTAAKLIRQDPYVRHQMGGGGFQNALRLAGLIKNEHDEIVMKMRVFRLMPQLWQNLGMTSKEVMGMIFGNFSDDPNGFRANRNVNKVLDDLGGKGLLGQSSNTDNLNANLGLEIDSDGAVAGTSNEIWGLGPQTLLKMYLGDSNVKYPGTKTFQSVI
jgi:hypothetical protein